MVSHSYQSLNITSYIMNCQLSLDCWYPKFHCDPIHSSSPNDNTPQGFDGEILLLKQKLFVEIFKFQSVLPENLKLNFNIVNNEENGSFLTIFIKSILQYYCLHNLSQHSIMQLLIMFTFCTSFSLFLTTVYIGLILLSLMTYFCDP